MPTASVSAVMDLKYGILFKLLKMLGIVFAANILLANRSLSTMLNEFPSRKVCQESLGLEKNKIPASD